MAKKLGQEMPTTQASNQQYVRALHMDLDDKDFSAVYEVTQEKKK
jgi:3-hydroxyisobutyrate dehydrogenase-like beta-hydroxyacid dehydrogenase